ncbi:MAG TPA: aminoacyl-tRNA hydrolase [Pseudomonadales bacterium]
MAIALLVGLGNPGPRYTDTRHNAGAWLVERFAAAHGVTLNPDSKCQGRTARLTVQGQDLRLLIPDNYMNLSGQSVGAAARFYRIDPESILVAHDELDLAPGTARLKLGGGPGGHNGLKDIIAALANQRDFYRLRIGIGHPGNAREVSDFVLGKPPQSERDSIDAAIGHALTVLPDIVAGNINAAMKTLHTQPKP